MSATAENFQEETQWYSELTPSGIEVRYSPAPKRMYQVRVSTDRGTPLLPDMGWCEVPSVTTVLGVLDKKALPWWAQGIGVEAVLELVRRGLLVWEE